MFTNKQPYNRINPYGKKLPKQEFYLLIDSVNFLLIDGVNRLIIQPATDGVTYNRINPYSKINPYNRI